MALYINTCFTLTSRVMPVCMHWGVITNSEDDMYKSLVVQSYRFMLLTATINIYNVTVALKGYRCGLGGIPVIRIVATTLVSFTLVDLRQYRLQVSIIITCVEDTC